MAPGDVLVVRGSGRLAELGNVGGFMGHVLVVTGAPHGVARGSPAAHELELANAWPAGGVSELWRLPVVESTRRESGLYESSQLMYVDRRTRQLLLVGEIGPTGELSSCDPEPAELWQCPEEVRADMRVDVMMQVLADMRAHMANWSAGTAFRAIVQPAVMTARPVSAETLQEIQSCWAKAPICTSVVIGFWQRYFSKLAGALDCPVAAATGSDQELSPGETVQYWSISLNQWIQGSVLRVNRDADGAIQSYDLSVRWGALPDRVRRCGRAQDAKSRAVGLIMRYMPLKADRALPGDLLSSMRECGWVSITQVPQIFRPMVMPQAPQAPRCQPFELDNSPRMLSHQC